LAQGSKAGVAKLLQQGTQLGAGITPDTRSLGLKSGNATIDIMQPNPMVTGTQWQPTAMVSNMRWFARSDSMDIINDPRFFGANVLDRRLDAFAGLGIVSGLLVCVAMDQAFGMQKDIHLFFEPTLKDYLQFAGFAIMSIVLYSNMISTYVATAQIYHTYRLMTGGPTGFESAKLYYLNPNIAFWRHISVKAMLNSLWLFMMSSGFRMWVKFSNDATGGPGWLHIGANEPEKSGPSSQPTFQGLTALGGIVCFAYMFMGLSVYYIHHKHVHVFRERYTKMAEAQLPLLMTTTGLGANRGNPLDV